MAISSATDHRRGFESLEEETSVASLPVQGELPRWLTGDVIRVTPARLEDADGPIRHWFDGLAMLNKFSLRGGEVAYANRYLDTQYRRRVERGKPVAGFATDPCRRIFRRMVTTFSSTPSDNTNVNLARVGDEYLAMTEASIPVAFDRDTLATLGHRRPAPGQITTAHPHVDPATGELMNYATHVGRRTTYRIYARRPGDGVRVLAELPTARAAYMHSFAMTEHYVVLVEFPLLLDPMDLALHRRSFIDSFHWRPERGTRMLIVDRGDGRVRAEARTEACFAFHHVNAFEAGEELVLDIAAYPDPRIVDALYLAPLRAGERVPAGELRRYRVPVGGGEARWEAIGGAAIELPRIDDSRDGRRHRFVYGAGMQTRPARWWDRLVKVDVDSGEVAAWHSPDCFPGEPVFVPDPTRRAGPAPEPEDAGVLLSVVLDAATGTSFLLALDAATMTELARATAPHAITFGFHGGYFPWTDR